MQMTRRIGGGGVQYGMRRQGNYEMDWKNSWRQKESHLDRCTHRWFGGDWSKAQGWGIWRRCDSSSDTHSANTHNKYVHDSM